MTDTHDYILFIHDDTPDGVTVSSADWEAYFGRLRAAGCFQGGSEIGDGVCVTKSSLTPAISAHLSGYIRIQASDLERAIELVSGNPVYEAGGTVEVRALPKT